MDVPPARCVKTIALARDPYDDTEEINARGSAGSRIRHPVYVQFCNRHRQIRRPVDPRYDRQSDHEVPSHVERDDAGMAEAAAGEPLIQVLAVRTIPTTAADHARK